MDVKFTLIAMGGKKIPCINKYIGSYKPNTNPKLYKKEEEIIIMGRKRNIRDTRKEEINGEGITGKNFRERQTGGGKE
jgi:hypothetical protein